MPKACASLMTLLVLAPKVGLEGVVLDTGPAVDANRQGGRSAFDYLSRRAFNAQPDGGHGARRSVQIRASRTWRCDHGKRASSSVGNSPSNALLTGSYPCAAMN